MRRYGVIDLGAGAGGFTQAVLQRPDTDTLLAVEEGILESCVFQTRFPQVPLVSIPFDRDNVASLHSSIVEALTKHKTSHIAILHMKTKNTFRYTVTDDKTPNDKLFNKILAFLTWTILECDWLVDNKLLSRWIIETDQRLFDALSVEVRNLTHSREFNQILFGIPQNKRFLILSNEPVSFKIPRNRPKPTWGPMLQMDAEAVMFHPRYEYRDIIQFASEYKLAIMEVRLAHEIAFDLHLNNSYLVSSGCKPDSVIAPLTSAEYAKFYGFTDEFFTVDLFIIYEKERKAMILLGKWPKVANAILDTIVSVLQAR